MPRPGQPPASTLRNRNRINNKSRLKIVHGNIDTDPIIPDEDEEKTRLLQSVAGVDQEDANEHHLQAVLSEAAQRNHSSHRSTRGSEKEKEKDALPAAFIPIPDSTGVVADYETLYPANRWRDPVSYIYSSSTVEESGNAFLAGGFTYYMDERDAEWLAKNNEEARGEGTSAQGAVSASGLRVSARSAKAKGKEPDAPQPVAMTEDEFELVMGLYEKMTHEKTEYLHHSLETGMAFPPFADYQDTFSLPLPPSTFTSFTLPSWLPSSAQLTRIARAVYPYWKERRVERGGHRIIPNLNFDESDTLNESYICFRRRDVKAVRKTRASQVTSSDKLARLQVEFSFPLELAKRVLEREQLKREAARHSQHIWLQRMQMVDLRRLNPVLAEKQDDELLVDRERPSKKSDSTRINGVKIPPKNDAAAQPPRMEITRPKERLAFIQAKMDSYLQKQKEVDQHWEDVVDTGYVQPSSTPASRLFKHISPSENYKDDELTNNRVPRRPVRMRYGRGGRLFIDRRFPSIDISSVRRRKQSDEDSMDVDGAEDQERIERLKERWKYDVDDGPSYGPNGSEEQDRVLVNDFDMKYQRYTIPLLVESDYACLLNDPTIVKYGPDGRKEPFVPFKLGQAPRPYANQQMISQTGQQMAAAAAQQNGATTGIALSIPAASIPVSQQMKMQPAVSQHMRISANGGMRRPPVPIVASMTNATPTASSPPRQQSVPQVTLQTQQTQQPTTMNGVNRPAINMPHVESLKQDGGNAFSASQQPSSQSDENQPQQTDPAANGQVAYASHPKSQEQMNYLSNGTHLNTVNGYTAGITGIAPYVPQQSALSLQQVQNLKSVFAAPSGQDAAALQANGGRPVPNSYMHVVPNNNFNMQLPNNTPINLKLPPTRQMQWATTGTNATSPPLQRPTSGMNGSVSPTPNVRQVLPVRTPSANGMHNGVRNVLPNGHQASLSPHSRPSPSPIPSIAQSQSPPRLSQTPVMSMVSPLMQHQQPVGNTQGGY